MISSFIPAGRRHSGSRSWRRSRPAYRFWRRGAGVRRRRLPASRTRPPSSWRSPTIRSRWPRATTGSGPDSPSDSTSTGRGGSSSGATASGPMRRPRSGHGSRRSGLMPEPTAVFLAVGGSRRRGVVEAAGRVVDRGGEATVVVGDPGPWAAEKLDPRIRMIALWPVERRRWPMRIEQWSLYGAPAGAFRLVGRGRLAGSAERAYASFERRVADRLHRRLALPALRSLFGDIRHRVLQASLAAGAPLDVIVIADAPSIPLAARLVRSRPHPAAERPLVTFSVGWTG